MTLIFQCSLICLNSMVYFSTVCRRFGRILEFYKFYKENVRKDKIHKFYGAWGLYFIEISAL